MKGHWTCACDFGHSCVSLSAQLWTVCILEICRSLRGKKSLSERSEMALNSRVGPPPGTPPKQHRAKKNATQVCYVALPVDKSECPRKHGPPPLRGIRSLEKRLQQPQSPLWSSWTTVVAGRSIHAWLRIAATVMNTNRNVQTGSSLLRSGIHPCFLQSCDLHSFQCCIGEISVG